MSNNSSHTVNKIKIQIHPLVKLMSEEATIFLIGLIPVIGQSLIFDRRTLSRLSAIFQSDDSIQRDIDKVMQNMNDTEEIMSRLVTHIERKRVDLQQLLDQYNRYRELASIEHEKAKPLLEEMKREGNKSIYWGIFSGLIMIILGIIIAHFLRIWVPGFNF